MRIVIPGGSGQVGQILARHWTGEGHDVVVLSRGGTVPAGRVVPWDGRSVEPAWAREIDGADVVLNLAGRTVNCRYTPENLEQMMSSRVDSTRAVGEAIATADRPPPVWLQMSTATIYAHRFDAPNDEATGIIGGNEPDVPRYWDFSVQIAKNWEAELEAAETPHTRKIALRTSMVMSPDPGGIFDVMFGIVRQGLGGAAGSGKQYVSWIHHRDFVRAVVLLVEREDLTGAFNLAAPGPMPQKQFMAEMARANGTWMALPATKWMLEVGAWAMRTDTELVLKSRRVVPGGLLELGFEFEFSSWPEAADDLVAGWRELRS